jgi:hypothetical protein
VVANIYRAAFWVAAALAFAMALLPQPPQLPGSPSDKLLHVAAFAVLAGLASFAYPRTSVLRLLIALSAFGASIEILQAIPRLNRDCDPIDWVSDTVAAGIVLALLRWRRRDGEN